MKVEHALVPAIRTSEWRCPNCGGARFLRERRRPRTQNLRLTQMKLVLGGPLHYMITISTKTVLCHYRGQQRSPEPRAKSCQRLSPPTVCMASCYTAHVHHLCFVRSSSTCAQVTAVVVDANLVLQVLLMWIVLMPALISKQVCFEAHT